MPFQKGNKLSQGRPKGSGKRQQISETFQAYLSGVCDGKTRLEALTERLFVQDPKTLLAYAYGKPVEIHAHQFGDGGNLLPQTLIDEARLVADLLYAKTMDKEKK